MDIPVRTESARTPGQMETGVKAMNAPLRALVFFFAVFFLGCGKIPEKIPSGTWNYKLFVNGVRVGSAVISNKAVAGSYVITSELNMGAGTIMNVSRQVITETMDFKPLKIETYNKVVNESSTQNINTVATINGRKIEVRSGASKTTVTMDRDFFLDGNYTMARLIENRFKKGLEISSYLYDPSIEIDQLIPITTKVKGVESVTVGDRRLRLIHIVQSLDTIKNADSYLDETGVLVKASIQMLNLKIELVRE
jgi:hypothetical protein